MPIRDRRGARAMEGVHTRKNSLRWKGFDYRTPRSYYVTLCVQGRRCLFGDVVRDEIVLTAAGRMVVETWQAIPRTFPTVRLDPFVVMPNHVHGILVFQTLEPGSPDLGRVVGWFKSRTGHAYRRGMHASGWPAYDDHLWQRGYHDRVLRDDEEHAHAVGYIWRNPERWLLDPHHPRVRAGDTPPETPWAP